jgi:transposase
MHVNMPCRSAGGTALAYKRLEQNAFKWSHCPLSHMLGMKGQSFACKRQEGPIKDGVLQLDPAQFEALFAGLDWRRVTAL